MSFKLLFPTYRTRERFVHRILDRLGSAPLGRMLNLGSGEGDVDAALAAFATELESCDVNADDVAFARDLNAHVPNLRYSVQDAGGLDFESASFDVVLCLEVIEHVSDPNALLAEITRVLRPGGAAVLTCPSVRFPITYDPINTLLAGRRTHVPLGAYAFGHASLPHEDELEAWATAAGLTVETKDRLSGALVGALECYWPGLLQRAFKANAGNSKGRGARAPIRPGATAPPLLRAVDAVIALDRVASTSLKSQRSVGLGYVLRKEK
jgi:SAM-dependent methyltransferase